MGKLKEISSMNEIEQYIFDNPQLLKRFMKDNEALLNEVKNKYADLFRDGDLIGRYLLSKALFEILRVTGEATKELLKQEMQEQHGMNLMDTEGKC